MYCSGSGLSRRSWVAKRSTPPVGQRGPNSKAGRDPPGKHAPRECERDGSRPGTVGRDQENQQRGRSADVYLSVSMIPRTVNLTQFWPQSWLLSHRQSGGRINSRNETDYELQIE